MRTRSGRREAEENVPEASPVEEDEPAQPVAAGDSDDEAPEEVGFTASKKVCCTCVMAACASGMPSSPVQGLPSCVPYPVGSRGQVQGEDSQENGAGGAETAEAAASWQGSGRGAQHQRC